MVPPLATNAVLTQARWPDPTDCEFLQDNSPSYHRGIVVTRAWWLIGQGVSFCMMIRLLTTGAVADLGLMA